MTGIVLWTDSDYRDTDTIQLEYAYMAYNDIVNQKDQYEWSGVDSLLDQVAGRGHQAILRFYFVYPGQSTTVPHRPTSIKPSIYRHRINARIVIAIT